MHETIDRRLNVPVTDGDPPQEVVRREHRSGSMLFVHHSEGLRSRGEQTASGIGNRVLRTADRDGASGDEVVHKQAVRLALSVEGLIVGRHATLGSDVLGDVRVLQNEGLEIVGLKRVNDDVGLGSRCMETRACLVVALETEHVAGTTHVAQRRDLARLVPEGDCALLNHKDMSFVRFTLPQHVFVGFVEPHASLPGQPNQIRIVDGMKGSVLLQKISDAITDAGGLHGTLILPWDEGSV